MNHLSAKAALPARVKWGYGAGGYASSIFFLNFVFYAMYFFTDIVGIGPAMAGMIVSVGAIWDAIIDPPIGFWSDRRDPLKGRRRPFLLWMAVPLTVFTFLSFYNPGLSPQVAPFYFMFIVIGAYTCQSLVDIPLTALGAEMTSDYDERSKLNTCRNIFWNIAMFLSCAFLMIVDYFAGLNNGDMSKGFAYTSLVCAAPIVVFLLIAYATTKGRELTEVKERAEKLDWKGLIVEPFKNRTFRYVTVVFALSIAAQAINNAVGLYYFLNNLGLDPAFASLLFVFSAIIGFGDSWLAGLIAKKGSKKVAWAVCMGGWAFSTLVMVMFILKPDAPLWLLGLFVIFNGLGLNTQYQLAYMMIPDCIEVDEFKTGHRREGMYYGLISLIQQGGAALTMGACGLLLAYIGYDGMAAAQSAFTLNGLRLLFGLGCGLFLVLSIVINAFSPMTRKRHSALVEAIGLKRAGKDYSTQGFQELL